MLNAALLVVSGFLITFIVEQLHSRGTIRTEVARKLIHVVAGLIVAICPFFVSWNVILVGSIGFFLAVSLARWLKIFGSQHGINRITWGEFFFPLSIFSIVLVHPSRWVFVLAMLNLAIGDTVAALVGTKLGHSNSYNVFGQKKSVAGSLAFFAVSAGLVAITFAVAPLGETALLRTELLILPFVATLAENVGVYGLDNLFIPLAVVLLLG